MKNKISMATGLPSVSNVLTSWFVNLNFVKITKETINFQIVETEEIINLKGVWQPMSPKQISILPEGQRSWSWFTIHCNSGSKINIDDIISKDGTRFRVMQRLSYPEYGYYEYHVCLDYQVPSGELYDRP